MASLDFFIDFVQDALQAHGGRECLRRPEFREIQNRVARRFGLALGRGLVQALVIGKRMRIGPHDAGVHQGRAVPGAAVIAAACA